MKLVNKLMEYIESTTPADQGTAAARRDVMDSKKTVKVSFDLFMKGLNPSDTDDVKSELDKCGITVVGNTASGARSSFEKYVKEYGQGHLKMSDLDLE